MRMIDSDGSGIELGVLGYQFPDADDPGLRRSWLVVNGRATCPQGSWTFCWQALTPPEAESLRDWLRTAVDYPVGGHGIALTFTEPNLSFALVRDEMRLIDLEVKLDLEFSPPWRRRTRTGDPYVLPLRLSPSAMLEASAAWAAEIPGEPG